MQTAHNIFNINDFSEGNINVLQEVKQKFAPVDSKGLKELSAPEIADVLLKGPLAKGQFLIICSNAIFDKGDMLRYLAYKLSKSRKLKIKEWQGSGDQDSLFLAIRNTTEASVLIVDDLAPSDIQYDVERLNKEATANGHTLLAASAGIRIWNPTAAVKPLFAEISDDDITYSEQTIRRVLQNKLNKHKHQYSFERTNSGFNAANILSGTLTVKQLAIEFTFPQQIDLFIRLIGQEDETLSQSKIEQLARQACAEDSFSFQTWLGPLEEHEKLMTLALSLSVGFTEGQFFSILKRVSDTSWGQRSKALLGVDYQDLVPLLSVFSVEPAETEESTYHIINAKYPKQQAQIFDAIWYSHRRHLMKAIPVLTDVVIESVEAPGQTPELYGSKSLRQRLRRSVAKNFGQLGLKSRELIEPALLRLASHENIGVQATAARAMARWREAELAGLPAPNLFRLLEQWQTDAQFMDAIHGLLNLKETVHSPNNYLKSTVILTLGYAAQYDPPEPVNNNLIEILESFYKDQNKLVRNRLRNAIPYITKAYGRNMQEKYWDAMLEHLDLIESAAKGCVWSWQDDPVGTERFLAKQLNEIDADDQEDLQGRYTRTDRYHAFLILCLGYLLRQEGQQVRIDGLEAGEWLWDLRRDLKHRDLKSLCWQMHISFGALPSGRYEEIEKRLNADLSKEEEKFLLQALGKQYMDERYALKGGDEEGYHKGRQFDLWLDNPRPELKIERLMYRWLLAEGSGWQPKSNDTLNLMRQISLLAFQEFASVFEHWEDITIEKKVEEREQKQKQEEEELAQYEYQVTETALVPLKESFLGKIWDSLFASKASQLQKSLKNIIKQSPKVEMNMILLVLKKWKTKNDEFATVANSLEKEIKKFQNQN